MNVSTWAWLGTLVALTALLLVDLIIIGRRPHEPSLRESTLWVIFYVALAGLFGVGVWLTSGGTCSRQRSVANRQRGAKRQPVGSPIGTKGSPGRASSFRFGP